MDTTRRYTMTARAEAKAATRRRILEAAHEVMTEQLLQGVALEAIAARAGVSVQTVLRHFGSRTALIEETFKLGREQVVAERSAPAGDLDAALHALVGHYESRGDWVLLMLAQEQHEPLVRRMTDQGREVHHAWVEETFAPLLGPRTAADRDELLDLLAVATDVFTWKLLRRDRRLGRTRTEARIRRLVDALLATHPSEEPS